MTVSFYTLGCKVNQYESQAMAELFEKNGFVVVDDRETADIIVINSCTVTEESSKKTKKMLRHFRKQNKAAVIVLTGCMPTAFKEASANIMEADVVVDNKNYDKIVETVCSYLEKRERLVSLTDHEKGEAFTPLSISNFSERTRAYIKIEDGCDRFCSYCIIPTARGRVRSKKPEMVGCEAAALSKNGYKEIVLVGINLSAYGKGEDFDLADAVKAVAEVKGIERIRLGSLEPDQISDETFKVLAECEKFCPQFHFSLQSGCDKTLKAMNRHYTADDYRNLAQKIYFTFKNPSLTTDVLVGFVGETDQDFEESLQFVKEIGFARSHVFSYSVRKGTKAEKMEGHVAESIKTERSKKMILAAAACERDFLSKQIGKTDTVLFERKIDGLWEGYTKNYSKIFVESNSDLKNTIKTVQITAFKDNFLLGEVVDNT